MFEQNTITKQFVEHIKELLDKGVVRNQKDVAEAIGWHGNSLSLAMAGKRNVPYDKYLKFKDVYGIKEHQPTLPQNDQYKEKYIALLESQVANYALLLNELREIKDLLRANK